MCHNGTTQKAGQQNSSIEHRAGESETDRCGCTADPDVTSEDDQPGTSDPSQLFRDCARYAACSKSLRTRPPHRHFHCCSFPSNTDCGKNSGGAPAAMRSRSEERKCVTLKGTFCFPRELRCITLNSAHPHL